MPKLVVFPNDPIYKYYEKGEIKPRYYNPMNLFDEVHLITLCEQDAAPEKVQTLVGNARLYLHPLGRPSFIRLPQLLEKASQIVSKIKPDIVRGHGILLGGLLAVQSARKNRIPAVFSVHCNPDEDFMVWLKRGWIRLSLSAIRQALWYILFQKYILSNAQQIICAYKFTERYASRHGAKNIVLIYNRVDTDRFKPMKPSPTKLKHPLVLSVNQQIEVKNPEPLIRAVKNLPVELLLIGDGVLHDHLRWVAGSLTLTHKVTFIKSVPHSEIHQYYQRADIFANPMQCGGVSMGTMEAMACGLPVVHARPLWEKEPEVLGDLGIVVEPTPEGFRSGIGQLVGHQDLAERLGLGGRRLMEKMNGQMMEKKERELYLNLLSSGSTECTAFHEI